MKHQNAVRLVNREREYVQRLSASDLAPARGPTRLPRRGGGDPANRRWGRLALRRTGLGGAPQSLRVLRATWLHAKYSQKHACNARLQ